MKPHSSLSIYSKKFLALFLGLGLSLLGLTTALATPVSTYNVVQTNATVGSSTDLELDYTVNTSIQDWSSGGDLIVNLPSNIGPSGWGALGGVSVEFDEDSSNDGVGETTLSQGTGLGQWETSGPDLTIHWDEASWVADSGDTIRIAITGVTPQFEDTTTTFSWSGTTTAGGDTDPSGIDDLNVAAGDPAATVSFGANSVVGGTGNTTVSFSPLLSLDPGDAIKISFPDYVNVSGVSFVSTSLTQSSGSTASVSCSAVSQLVTCTLGGDVVYTSASGNIVLSGITPYYAGTNNITSLRVEDEGGPNTIGVDSDVALTDVTASDAAASLTLFPSISGYEIGENTLSFTLPIALDTGDVIKFTFPAGFDPNGITWVSQSFGGGGTLSCSALSQTVTCTTTGTINAGSSSVILGVISRLHVTTADVTNFLVEDEGNASNIIASDSTVPTTDVTAADPTASIVLASPIVGGVGETTMTFGIPTTLDAADTVEVSFPSYIDVSGVTWVSQSFGGSGTFSCSSALQVVTCTVNSGMVIVTGHTGDIVLSGITASQGGTTDISSFLVKDEGTDIIASDTSVALTDVTGDANATVTLGANSVVGSSGSTTASFTISSDLSTADTVEITFPSMMNVASAVLASETFAGAGTFTCAAALQVVTCTATGTITAGTGDIVLSGIKAAHTATTNITSFLVKTGSTVLDSDSVVALTDTTAANASGTVVIDQARVGASGDVVLTLSTATALDAADTVVITFPSYMDVSGVDSATSTNFVTASGSPVFTCAAASQVVTCTVSGGTFAAANDKTLTLTGITASHAGTTDITSLLVRDEGVSGDNISTDTSVSLTDVTASDANAVVSLGANSVVGTSGNTTIEFTLPIDLDAADTVELTFPSFVNVPSTPGVSDTFLGAGGFACAGASQVVTCTADGAITADTGSLILTGLTTRHASTTDITSFVVNDEGVSGDTVVSDSAVALTDATAADAAASVTLGSNSVVGSSGTTTLTFTLPIDLDAADTVEVTFPSLLSVSSAALSSETFAGAGTFACVAASQVVTCTANGAITAGSGTVILSGITATSAGSTDITSFVVNDEGSSGDTIATDSIVSLTNTTEPSSSGGSGGGGGGAPIHTSGHGSSSSSSSSSSNTGTTEKDPFSDLKKSSPYYESVMNLFERGIVNGYSDGTIRVENEMNRAELMKIVVLGVTEAPDAATYKNCFSDVGEEWFAPYVCYAKEQGWVSGYPDGSFRPGNSANQVEILKMIMRANGIETAAPKENQAWYVPYVAKAFAMGLLGEGISPAEVSTRGYAFQILATLSDELKA